MEYEYNEMTFEEMMNQEDPECATVRMYPVCSCGNVLYDLVIDTEYMDDKKCYPIAAHKPGRCPKCNKQIWCIQTFDFHEEYEENGYVDFNYAEKENTYGM